MVSIRWYVGVLKGSWEVLAEAYKPALKQPAESTLGFRRLGGHLARLNFQLPQ